MVTLTDESMITHVRGCKIRYFLFHVHTLYLEVLQMFSAIRQGNNADLQKSLVRYRDIVRRMNGARLPEQVVE